MSGGYRWHEHDFIQEVAASRGCRLEGGAGSRWVMHSPAHAPELPWSVTLTHASGEHGPDIVWRCQTLRAGDDPARQFVVRAGGATPSSSLGDVEGGVAGLLAAGAVLAIGALRRQSRRHSGRQAPRTEVPRAPQTPEQEPVTTGPLGPAWAVTDPAGVLDDALRPLFEQWPTAWWGKGDERPAALGSAWLNQRGLELTAQEWWCSAPALNHLITLGVDLANRLRAAGF